MAVEFAEAQPAEIKQICDLLGELFTAELEFEPDRVLQQQGVEQIFANPDQGLILVARENHQVIAMINVLFNISTALGGPVAFFDDVVVAESNRGRGIGNDLLGFAIEYVKKERNCKRVMLHTDFENTVAQKLYEKHGFKRSTMLTYKLIL